MDGNNIVRNPVRDEGCPNLVLLVYVRDYEFIPLCESLGDIIMFHRPMSARIANFNRELSLARYNYSFIAYFITI